VIIVSKPSAKAARRVRTDRSPPAHSRTSATHNDAPKQPNTWSISVHTECSQGIAVPSGVPEIVLRRLTGNREGGGVVPSPSTPLDMRARIRWFVKPFGRDAARSGSGSSGKDGSSRCGVGQLIPIVAGKDMCVGDQQLRANHKTGPRRRPSTSRSARCCGSARPASRPRGPYESAVHPVASSTLSQRSVTFK
jgi:hypothetical protein